MKDKIQCSVMVAGEGAWGAFHQHKCRRPAIIERDSKWYCKIHDPEYVKTKSDARYNAYKEQQLKEHKAWERKNTLLRIASGIGTDKLKRHEKEIREFLLKL